jgi:hypothetical protein
MIAYLLFHFDDFAKAGVILVVRILYFRLFFCYLNASIVVATVALEAVYR